MTDRSKDPQNQLKNKQHNAHGDSKLDGLHLDVNNRVLDLKSKGLGPNDAYNIAKKIKVF